MIVFGWKTLFLFKKGGKWPYIIKKLINVSKIRSYDMYLNFYGSIWYERYIQSHDFRRSSLGLIPRFLAKIQTNQAFTNK